MNLEVTERRELSCFFCREFFSLYIEGHIDINRKSQIEGHIEKCAACSVIFKKIKISKEILIELSNTRQTQGLIDYVKKEQYFWSEAFEKVGWKNWPVTLKWATELSLIAVVLTVVIHVVPWFNVMGSFNKMRIRSETVQSLPASPELIQVAGQEAGQNVILNTKQSGVDTDAIEQTEETSRAQIQVAKMVPQLKMFAGDPRVPFGPNIPDDIRQHLNDDSPVDEETLLTSKNMTANPDDGQLSGFFWKGSLKVEKLSDELTGRVTKTITDLGGVRAGQMELGWHKGRDRYYHFILPEENYEKFLSKMNSEGIMVLTKQPHSRIIKEGHLRIILTLEESE